MQRGYWYVPVIKLIFNLKQYINYQHKYFVFNHKYQPAINFVVVLIKTGLHILT